MKMNSFRDVPIADMLLATQSSHTLPDTLRAAIAEPWFVIDKHGKRWLAYGPWQVVEWTRSPLRQQNEVRVVRWNVRRTSAHISKHPLGTEWDTNVMGPLPSQFGGAIVEHEETPNGVRSRLSKHKYIRSQVIG